MTIKWIGAHVNNFGVGRAGKSVNKIVLHWIAGTLTSADATFQKPDRIASAHYGIGGTAVHQYVKEEDTAYHCGVLDQNRQSIGIEHEGDNDLPITEATIKTSIELVADICKRYGLVPSKDTIKRHSDFKATQCPGTLPVERIIQEVAALLAPKDTPSDDEKRALMSLTKFRDANEELKTGNLEGAISAAVGAYKDLPKIKKENETITGLVTGLNRDLGKKTTALEVHENNWKDLAGLLNCKPDYPTIKAEIRGLIDVEDVAENAQPDDLVNGLVKLIRKIFGGR